MNCDQKCIRISQCTIPSYLTYCMCSFCSGGAFNVTRLKGFVSLLVENNMCYLSSSVLEMVIRQERQIFEAISCFLKQRIFHSLSSSVNICLNNTGVYSANANLGCISENVYAIIMKGNCDTYCIHMVGHNRIAVMYCSAQA